MEKIINGKRYFLYSSLSYELKKIYYTQIYKYLNKLVFEYHGFQKWYQNLFTNSYDLKQNREIIICEDFLHIIGIAIIKDDFDEKKICTLRVSKSYQHQGIGHNLVELCLSQLNTEKPMITLHKNKLYQFEKIFKYYNFELEQTQKHYYSIFNTELVFNGFLPQKKCIFNQIELIDIEKLYKTFILNGQTDFEEFINLCIHYWYDQEKFKHFSIS